MKATKTSMVAAMWMATAAATFGLAAPAHADAPVNLTVTDGVRTQLVQAGAVLTGRPASEYSGLRPGKTYYAYQPGSVEATYWAAAALDGPKTELAGIRLQERGPILLAVPAVNPRDTNPSSVQRVSGRYCLCRRQRRRPEHIDSVSRVCSVRRFEGSAGHEQSLTG